MSDAPAGIVIVGAGQAGGRAAEALRAAQFRGPITMIGSEVHLPYERPQLSKAMLLDVVPPAFLRSANEWSDIDVDVKTGSAAVALDTDRRVVGLSDGREFGYAKLLLATGTRPRRLPDLETGPVPVLYLRDIDDAVALQQALLPNREVVLIGAGVIGLEVAAAAVARGCSVTVVEAMPTVLAQVGSPAISAFFMATHAAHGVSFKMGRTVQRNVAGGVDLSDGSFCPADVILVGIGVEPTCIQGTKIFSRQNGIRVDRHARTEMPDIYSVGDVAQQWNVFSDTWMRIENWANAQDQAAAAARAMTGQDSGYDLLPWFWTDQFKINLQVVGSFAGAAEIVRGDPATGKFTVVALRDGLICGGATVNAPKDMAVLRRLVSQQRRTDRHDLENPGYDLKRALTA